MTGRERFEAALSASGSPEIPAAASCYEDIYARDHWDDLTSCPWWYSRSPDLDQQMEWHRNVIARTGEDWFRLPFCASREQRQNTMLEVGAGGVFLLNRRTGQREELFPEPVNGTPQTEYNNREQLALTEAEIDGLVPVPDSDPNAVVAEGRNDLALRLLGEFGSRLYASHRSESPLLGCGRLWGFEGLMMMIVTRPDLVHYACERYLARHKQRVAEAALLGADAIWIPDGFVDLVSPKAFAELDVPYMARLVEAIHAAGMKSIYYFTGNPAGKWDLILSIGADAIAVEESKKGFSNDIEAIASRVQGRCTLFGNLDPLGILKEGSEEELRAEVARQLAAGQRNGNRFVMSLGSPVTPETPVQRVRLFCDLVHELGRA